MTEAARAYSTALRHVYRDPDTAGRTIGRMAGSAGVPATLQAIGTDPGVFGELKGHTLAGHVLAGTTRDRDLRALPELAERADAYLAADLALRAARARVEELTTRLHAARAEARELDESLRALPSRSALLRELSTLAHEVEHRAPAELRRLDEALSPPHRALLREATARAKELERGREREDELER